jgi:acetyltransferase-like isoleucine patch superfamily enzyme
VTHLDHDWFDRPLPDNVQIGERSWLYSSYAFRHYASVQTCGVRVGHDTGLYNRTFFDLGPDGTLTIGNYCTIVGGIFATNHVIDLGDYVFIAHEVVIADEQIALPGGAILSAQEQRRDERSAERRTRIGDGAWLAARSIVIGPVEIGAGAIVGAGAVVSSDVPPFSVVAGNPATVVRRLR